MDKNKEILEKSIAYAKGQNTFNKRTMIEQADNVCVFGLGKFFQDAFVSKHMKEKYKVNLLCDNNPEKWGNPVAIKILPSGL